MNSLSESNEETLYDAVQVVYDPDTYSSTNGFIYDRYYPALHVLDTVSDLIADSAWYKGEKFDWAPVGISSYVKKGMKAGYLWAKAELANG